MTAVLCASDFYSNANSAVHEQLRLVILVWLWRFTRISILKTHIIRKTYGQSTA